MIYSWKPGARKGGKAQEVGEALEAIRAENRGALAPSDVVESATNKASVLHRYFEWDDIEAAHQWRVEQARDLIRSVCVVVEEAGDVASPVRAFVHVTADDGPYVGMVEAMSDATMRKLIIERALDEVRSWRQRHKELNELAAIFAAVDRVVA